MQAKCPKCDSTAFRMLRGSQDSTEVECLTCGHVATLVPTLANGEGAGNPAMHRASSVSAAQIGVAWLSDEAEDKLHAAIIVIRTDQETRVTPAYAMKCRTWYD